MNEDYGELKKLITSLSSKVDSKFDKIANQIQEITDKLMKKLDEKIQESRQELMNEINALGERVAALERTRADQSSTAGDIADVKAVIEFEPDTTVVAINMANENEEEDITDAARRLVEATGEEDIEVVRATRLGARNGKPGVVKIQVPSKEDKIRLLRGKRNLKESREFKKTYIRSSKSHVERLVDVNFRTILKELPGGDQYRLTGSGRVIRKADYARQQEGNADASNSDDEAPSTQYY